MFRACPRLEVSGSMEDNFTSTENDATIADSSESLEKDGSSTKNNCTGTEDDDLDVAEQELDEESIPMLKEGGWISHRYSSDQSKRFGRDRMIDLSSRLSPHLLQHHWHIPGTSLKTERGSSQHVYTLRYANTLLH